MSVRSEKNWVLSGSAEIVSVKNVSRIGWWGTPARKPFKSQGWRPVEGAV